MTIAWTPQHDRALLDEMSVSEVFHYRKGTPERGQVWDSIAVNLNGVSQRKSKVRPFSQRGRTTAQERPAKADTGAVAVATTNESSFTLSDEKNGGKAEKLEQFIYQFTSVRCFLILF